MYASNHLVIKTLKAEVCTREKIQQYEHKQMQQLYVNEVEGVTFRSAFITF